LSMVLQQTDRIQGEDNEKTMESGE